VLTDELLCTYTHCSIINKLKTSTQLFIKWDDFQASEMPAENKGMTHSSYSACSYLLSLLSHTMARQVSTTRPKTYSLADARFKKSCSNLQVSIELKTVYPELKDSLKTFTGIITQQDLS